jgi:hypothetical protein
LTAGISVAKTVHIAELRTRIDAQRVVSGLAPFAWTDGTLSAATTTIRAQHILDLREALRRVYVAYSRRRPTPILPSRASSSKPSTSSSCAAPFAPSSSTLARGCAARPRGCRLRADERGEYDSAICTQLAFGELVNSRLAE